MPFADCPPNRGHSEYFSCQTNLLKISKVRLYDQAGASILTCQKFILKSVMHILFAVKDVFPKDLEPMLFSLTI